MSDISPFLVQSFAQHRGARGVHFYDETSCEFLPWDAVMGKVQENFPEAFNDKLIEAIANYDPNSEFVTVTAGDGQITIELFKAETM